MVPQRPSYQLLGKSRDLQPHKTHPDLSHAALLSFSRLECKESLKLRTPFARMPGRGIPVSAPTATHFFPCCFSWTLLLVAHRSRRLVGFSAGAGGTFTAPLVISGYDAAFTFSASSTHSTASTKNYYTHIRTCPHCIYSETLLVEARLGRGGPQGTATVNGDLKTRLTITLYQILSSRDQPSGKLRPQRRMDGYFKVSHHILLCSGVPEWQLRVSLINTTPFQASPSETSQISVPRTDTA